MNLPGSIDFFLKLCRRVVDQLAHQPRVRRVVPEVFSCNHLSFCAHGGEIASVGLDYDFQVRPASVGAHDAR
jgi:hypothetical protein